jgi:hypothetical protein
MKKEENDMRIDIKKKKIGMMKKQKDIILIIFYGDLKLIIKQNDLFITI